VVGISRQKNRPLAWVFQIYEKYANIFILDGAKDGEK